MKKLAIIGHFGLNTTMTDGQTVKTRTIASALSERYGSDCLLLSDTHGGARTLLRLPFTLLRLLKNAEHIMILPAQRGVRIIVPLLAALNRFFHRGLHYCVIGGWLPELLARKRLLCWMLRAFDGIYPETETMKKALEALGFTGVSVIPNCKDLDILPVSALRDAFSEPYRLCTFSRVMREKGIEDAVEAVERINAKFGRTVYTLDIFGPVDPGQRRWFDDLKLRFPVGVRYCGAVSERESGRALADCFALLFPTRFFTEGVPGTIIDAYAAGVPVIASRWESFSDVIDDGVTGIGYDFADREGLYRVLTELVEQPQRLRAMRISCLKRAKSFRPQDALAPLFIQLET